MKLEDLTRRQARYWYFRFRTAAEAGAPAKGAPAGLKKRLEAHPYFGGWEGFGITWDVGDDPFSPVPLRISLEVQWNTEAMASARELPKPEE
jgi:hypothetical protein